MESSRHTGLAPQWVQVTAGSEVLKWASQGPGGGGHSGPKVGKGAGPGEGRGEEIGEERGEEISEGRGGGTGGRRGEGTGEGLGEWAGVVTGGGPSTCWRGEARCGGRSRITAAPRLLPRTILLLPSTSPLSTTLVEELSSVAWGREGEEEL